MITLPLKLKTVFSKYFFFCIIIFKIHKYSRTPNTSISHPLGVRAPPNGNPCPTPSNPPTLFIHHLIRVQFLITNCVVAYFIIARWMIILKYNLK